jgi:uncharacterized membrane protein
MSDDPFLRAIERERQHGLVAVLIAALFSLAIGFAAGVLVMLANKLP